MVGHDPASGEVRHYTYPAGQSTFLPHVITASSDVPQQHSLTAGTLAQPAACMPTSMPSAATLGAGDSSANVIPPDGLLVSSHHTVPDPRHHGTQQCYVTATPTSSSSKTLDLVRFSSHGLNLLDSVHLTVLIVVIL